MRHFLSPVASGVASLHPIHPIASLVDIGETGSGVCLPFFLYTISLGATFCDDSVLIEPSTSGRISDDLRKRRVRANGHVQQKQ